MICSSNVFFIDNPDLDLKLRLKPDPNPDPKKKNRIHNTGSGFCKHRSIPPACEKGASCEWNSMKRSPCFCSNILNFTDPLARPSACFSGPKVRAWVYFLVIYDQTTTGSAVLSAWLLFPLSPFSFLEPVYLRFFFHFSYRSFFSSLRFDQVGSIRRGVVIFSYT